MMTHRKLRARHAAVLLLAAPLAAAAGASAQVPDSTRSVQSVEVRVTQSWSGHRDMDSPTGVGAAIRFGVQRRVHGLIGYRYRANGRTRTDFTCQPIFDPTCTGPERVEWDFDLHTVDVGVGFSHLFGDSTTWRASLTGSLSRLHGEGVGLETGRRNTHGEHSALGAAWTLGAARPWGPVRLFLDGRMEFVRGGSCGTDAYFPFCEATVFYSLEAGVALTWAAGRFR